MKNTYLTSHFPLIAILFFSLSFALYAENVITTWLRDIGLYMGMREFFSDVGIKLTLLFLLVLLFFMVFSALKLIADTINELSLLFFSKDEEGSSLQKIRGGSWFYLLASILSIFFMRMPLGIIITFLLGTFVYFIYFVYKASDSMSTGGLIGMIFFHISFWSAFIFTISYAAIRLYNSLINSLPL
ncbi:DUF5366 family protein [Alteribacillus iranensis]|uniref:Uncharacterized protein n=1 Tax=Alteribacillus iranensis TaxID=930128 RepID=A0A1I2FNU5_9BACI|nr:DUF5366 family protein [Alteribacillus iranensis]SFF06091.1 hypothetical protein SAMN05192532_11526 [Alteribacillus iranensis]